MGRVSSHLFLMQSLDLFFCQVSPLLARYERRNPCVTPHDIKTAKHFVEGVTSGMKINCPGLSLNTVLQRWTDFLAGWQRRDGNTKIPSKVSKTIYNVREPSRQGRSPLVSYTLLTSSHTSTPEPSSASVSASLWSGGPSIS